VCLFGWSSVYTLARVWPEYGYTLARFMPRFGADFAPNLRPISRSSSAPLPASLERRVLVTHVALGRVGAREWVWRRVIVRRNCLSQCCKDCAGRPNRSRLFSVRRSLSVQWGRTQSVGEQMECSNGQPETVVGRPLARLSCKPQETLSRPAATMLSDGRPTGQLFAELLVSRRSPLSACCWPLLVTVSCGALLASELAGSGRRLALLVRRTICRQASCAQLGALRTEKLARRWQQAGKILARQRETARGRKNNREGATTRERERNKGRARNNRERRVATVGGISKSARYGKLSRSPGFRPALRASSAEASSPQV